MSSTIKSALLLWLLYFSRTCLALSATDASMTRSRLLEALLSPSGKLTISPEIVIPEPRDPTAILIQTNAIQTLSERVRSAKANAAWISGGVSAVGTFFQEQEIARGSFPGPLPLIYSASKEELDPVALAEAGVCGVTIPVCGGVEFTSIKDDLSSSDWITLCQSCLEAGVQPIPEVTLAGTLSQEMKEQEVEQLVEKIKEAVNMDPVAILFTMNPLPTAVEEEDNDSEESPSPKQQQQALPDPVPLPKIPKAIGKKIPLLGSIRVTAGENRLGIERERFQKAGFTGVVLRSDCVPGFRLNPDLDIVGQFWAACINDLKSTRSKSFQFNSRNNMEKNMSAEWAKYQQGVIESGALGDPNESYSIVDEAAGEYKGFA